MKNVGDREVNRYLRDLERHLRHIPRGRRREVVDEVRSHIAVARAELVEETGGEIFALLERLGRPEDIAAETEEHDAPPGAVAAVRLIAGIVLLAFAALVLLTLIIGLANNLGPLEGGVLLAVALLLAIAGHRLWVGTQVA